MDRELFAGMTPKQKVENLLSNCDKVEEIGYMKQFTTDQIGAMKDELSSVAIAINDIEIEKKEANAAFKDALKPIIEEKKGLLKNIKQKAEFVKENCYKMTDFDEKMVGFYNADGLLISSRPMQADEFQRTIPMGKTGTND